MATFERRNYSDQLNIDTPEQVDLRFQVAGLGSRFVAILLDHLIQFAFYLLLIIVLLVVFAGSRTATSAASEQLDTAGKWFVAAFIFANFCIVWGYFSLFEAFWRGQTPGKRVMRLRVIKDTGRQITFFEALARNLLRTIDYLPSLYLVGVITMLCNKRNKRLGDFAAGTIVVHEVRDAQPMFVQAPTFLMPNVVHFDSAVTNAQAMFPPDAIAKLDSKDLLVIDTFFGRALDLNLDTRATMALRVATGMCAKMGLALPEGNPERALEAIAVQMRGLGRPL